MDKVEHSERLNRLRLSLKEARKQSGLTQEQLANRIGAYKSFVSKYERGERQLDVIEFIDISKALGRDATYFINQIS